MCLGLGACSNDDTSRGDSSDSGSFLIGRWTEDYNDSEYDVTDTWTFNENGTGTLKRVFYYEDSSRVADRDSFTFYYTYNDTTKRLTIVLSDTKSDYTFTYDFIVKSVTNDELYLNHADGSGSYGTLYRDK